MYKGNRRPSKLNYRMKVYISDIKEPNLSFVRRFCFAAGLVFSAYTVFCSGIFIYRSEDIRAAVAAVAPAVFIAFVTSLSIMLLTQFLAFRSVRSIRGLDATCCGKFGRLVKSSEKSGEPTYLKQYYITVSFGERVVPIRVGVVDYTRAHIGEAVLLVSGSGFNIEAYWLKDTSKHIPPKRVLPRLRPRTVK